MKVPFYVLLGSEIGAITAFYSARLTGVDVVNNWMGGWPGKTMVGSQNTLMAIVFVSRLLPFLSFDVVSYVAGLILLSFLRFATATFNRYYTCQFSAGPFWQRNGIS